MSARAWVAQGLGVGVLLATLICLASAGIEALYGHPAGFAAAIVFLAAVVAGIGRWLYLEWHRPVVSTAPSAFTKAPDWGFDPDRPPADRFDPKIVIAAVETSRLGHVWAAPISTHEVHAAAWKCERQGQLPDQIAETFQLESWQVVHLLSYEDPDDALAQRTAAWGQA